jgi:hypothetical protein
MAWSVKWQGTQHSLPLKKSEVPYRLAWKQAKQVMTTLAEMRTILWQVLLRLVASNF